MNAKQLNTHKKKGFSLTELAIVLVIIGLIIGGVTAGISMQNSAKVQQVMKETQFYITVVREFKAVYDQYPGDIDIAEDIWGVGTTNNGNGDDHINWDVNDENFLMWQHLELAEFIGGSFSGVQGSVIGVNFPESKIYEGAGYMFQYYNPMTWLFDERPVHILEYGAVDGSIPDTPNRGGVHTASEAYFIDNKIDDGEPDDGNIYGYTGQDIIGLGLGHIDSVCGLGTKPDRVYNLANKERQCRVVYLLRDFPN